MDSGLIYDLAVRNNRIFSVSYGKLVASSFNVSTANISFLTSITTSGSGYTQNTELFAQNTTTVLFGASDVSEYRLDQSTNTFSFVRTIATSRSVYIWEINVVGDRMWTSYGGGGIVEFNLTTNAQIRTTATPVYATRTEMLPNGLVLMVAGWDGYLYALRMSDFALLGGFSTNINSDYVTLLPFSDALVYCSGSVSLIAVSVSNFSNMTAVQAVNDYASGVLTALRFSPDRRFLYACWESGPIVSYSVNPVTGRLTFSGKYTASADDTGHGMDVTADWVVRGTASGKLLVFSRREKFF